MKLLLALIFWTMLVAGVTALVVEHLHKCPAPTEIVNQHSATPNSPNVHGVSGNVTITNGGIQ